MEDWKLTNARLTWATTSMISTSYSYGFSLEKASITDGGSSTTGLTRLADRLEYAQGINLSINTLYSDFFDDVNAGNHNGNGNGDGNGHGEGHGNGNGNGMAQNGGMDTVGHADGIGK